MSKPKAPELDLAHALQQATLVHDRRAIELSIRRMAARIRNDYAGARPVYLTIMKGGMVFASQLALELGIDVEFDYLHATRYRGNTSGKDLAWIKEPGCPMRGKRVLLVDDILDEGPTLAAVRQHVQQRGAAEVRIAVLAWKRHARTVPGLTPDYYGLDVPDRYVFGYGMDFHEQGRNLPGIYAI